jgi:polygalacturonase
VIRKGVTKLARPLVLASDEELFLEDGAVLTADAESKDFPVCGRKDSLERPLTWLITTEPGATNVAIRGSGVIDANGTEMFRRGMLVSAVVPHACDGFVMEGVTVVDGNFWTVTPVRSRNVRLRDVAVLNDVDDLRENDAFDVCESSDVVVENCLGVSRDDSFSTKTWSGHRGQVAAKWHGGPLPLERVLFKGCTAWTRCAAFKVGDGVSQPQRDVVFRDSRAFGCRHAVRYSHANGLAETKGVVFENIRIDSWDNRKWPFGWLDIAPAEAGVPGELTLRNIIVRE